MKRSDGFTLIELILLIFVVCVLGTVVALTHSGVQVKSRNNERQIEINILENKLEAYYAENNNSKYPSLAELNNPAWRVKNMPSPPTNGQVSDPSWSSAAKACTVAYNNQKVSAFSGKPAANCYAYEVTSATGEACDNITVACAHYALAATLEGGGKYVQTSLN